MVRSSKTHSDAIADERRPTKPKIVIIAPMLARYDGISNAVRDTYLMLEADGAWDVTVLALRNDFVDIPVEIIGGVGDLLIHPAYLKADLLIYHFGMFNDLINALLVGNGHARQAVVFHNITPKQFIEEAHWPVIEASFRQIVNLREADEVWAVSEVNARVAEERGVDRRRIQVIPSVVDSPKAHRLSDKRSTPVEVLYVGRIVPAKGVLDIVQAAHVVRGMTGVPFRLRIAGSLEWSDKQYAAEVRQFVSAHRMDDIVEFRGTVSDAERERLYHAAHVLAIPSYHEGFCKPVVEGLRAGCIPVGYDGYNLPYITNGFGKLAPSGDIEALATALAVVVQSLGPARSAPEEPRLPLDRGATSMRAFEKSAGEYVETFTSAQVAQEQRRRVDAVLAEPVH